MESLPKPSTPSIKSLAFSHLRFPTLFSSTPLSDHNNHPIYSIDDHVHTADHSPTPHKTPLSHIRKVAKKNQVDLVVITDHMSTRTSRHITRLGLDEGPLPRLYPGSEEGSAQGHIGVWSFPARNQLKVQSTFQKLMKRIQEINPQSLRVLNHPGWLRIGARHYNEGSFQPHHPSGSLHAFEIMNGNPLLRFTSLRLLDQWHQFLSKGYRISLVGGSDAHISRRVGSVVTMVAADSPSLPVMIEAIKKGRTYVTDGPRLRFTLSPKSSNPRSSSQFESPPIYSYGDTFLIANPVLQIQIQIHFYTELGGDLFLVHNGRNEHKVSLVPGCSSLEINIPATHLKQDGYFYIKFVHKEFKPLKRPRAKKRRNSKQRKPKKKVRGNYVDYLSLISSPIYYDIPPFKDHWRPKNL